MARRGASLQHPSTPRIQTKNLLRWWCRQRLQHYRLLRPHPPPSPSAKHPPRSAALLLASPAEHPPRLHAPPAACARRRLWPHAGRPRGEWPPSRMHSLLPVPQGWHAVRLRVQQWPRPPLRGLHRTLSCALSCGLSCGPSSRAPGLFELAASRFLLALLSLRGGTFLLLLCPLPFLVLFLPSRGCDDGGCLLVSAFLRALLSFQISLRYFFSRIFEVQTG